VRNFKASNKAIHSQTLQNIGEKIVSHYFLLLFGRMKLSYCGQGRVY